MKCRHCNNKLNIKFLDLGTCPPSNSFLSKKNLGNEENCYPLRVLVCGSCWLVQTEDFVAPAEMFRPNYAYFSSISAQFLEHARNYVDNIVSRFLLNEESMVAEIAANDGYLLQYVKNKDIPCYGIEPTESASQIAISKGIHIVREFFGNNLANSLAKRGQSADLTIANNVLAHVPDINDFVKGFCTILKPQGVAIFENPHLLKIIEKRQFDTVYHEHFSYLSLTAVSRIFRENGLTVFDVEEFPIHGGSLRYYAQKSSTGTHPISENVEKVLSKERNSGVETSSYYELFQGQAEMIKKEFNAFLLEQKYNSKSVVGYGAAAKGNTLLNFCGAKNDLLSYIIDKNTAKQGQYTPGSKIPIVGEELLLDKKPDFVVIFPWNIVDEIEKQLSYVRKWGCKFVTAIPRLRIF